MQLYYFTILQRDDEYLAVIENQNTYWELGHYYDQGFTLVMSVQAFNAKSAIEIAKQNTKSEIARLQFELNDLRQKYQELQNERRWGRFGRSSIGINSQPNDIDPLEVLGFKEMPSREELRKRYKSLSQKVHADKGGNDFLMRMVKEAYDNLSKNA
ncbi:hypothetical protein ABIE61_000947 [Marinobacterium sp. MBR-111]|jgi:hypothetical protein|uniref:J domain-containing protein n=1 Tax=Marinobacterium sp. MBR-111 TaxID=3156463 RepID=UPI00339ACBE7